MDHWKQTVELFRIFEPEWVLLSKSCRKMSKIGIHIYIYTHTLYQNESVLFYSTDTLIYFKFGSKSVEYIDHRQALQPLAWTARVSSMAVQLPQQMGKIPGKIMDKICENDGRMDVNGGKWFAKEKSSINWEIFQHAIFDYHRVSRDSRWSSEQHDHC